MEIRTAEEAPGRYRRELWLDSETQVAHLFVLDYVMRIGSAQVRMSGIGDVYTERAHRMKGYMRVLYEDTVAYMTREGYDVSMLFGIPNFYTKWGYAVCMPECSLTIKTRDAELAGELARPIAARPIAAGDMPAVLELYNHRNATRTCSIVRSLEGFPEFTKGSWYGTPTAPLVWTDETGRLLGYAAIDKADEEVKVTELEAWDEGLFPTMLYAIVEQAVAKRCETITIYAPSDGAFASYVQRYGGKWAISYNRHGGAMMRILNQLRLFEKLAPEFSRRLAALGLATATGRVCLVTDLGVVALDIASGAVSVSANGLLCREEVAIPTVRLPQELLTQWLVGYRSVADGLNSPGVEADAEAIPLLNALFPKHDATMWRADHF